MKKSILIGLTTFAVCYLLVAFIQFDLNAAHWNKDIRFLLAFIGTLVSIGVGLTYSINNNYK